MSRCDCEGCRGIPKVEVFNLKLHCWSYLCKKHYQEELAKPEDDNLAWCELTRWEQFAALVDFIWMPVANVYYRYLYRHYDNVDISELKGEHND